MRRWRVPRKRPQPRPKRIGTHRTRAPLHQLHQVLISHEHAGIAQECRSLRHWSHREELMLLTIRKVVDTWRHPRWIAVSRERRSVVREGNHKVESGRPRGSRHYRTWRLRISQRFGSLTWLLYDNWRPLRDASVPRPWTSNTRKGNSRKPSLPVVETCSYPDRRPRAYAYASCPPSEAAARVVSVDVRSSRCLAVGKG